MKYRYPQFGGSAMKRRVLVTILGLFVAPFVATQTPHANSIVDVYKSPTCRCCSNWVEHMRRNGFTVRTTTLTEAQLAAFKARHRVPERMQSCHTALIDGYVIEGHVPAADVQRLLEDRTAVLGLAVPGMVRGTPGMEAPGAEPQPYNVIAFDKQGNTRTFATRRG